jgi:hypothetical protein
LPVKNILVITNGYLIRDLGFNDIGIGDPFIGWIGRSGIGYQVQVLHISHISQFNGCAGIKHIAGGEARFKVEIGFDDLSIPIT